MVLRRYLTKEFIEQIELPEKGDVWIADTIVRGFGLRLWRTGMAFGIRINDQNGKPVRKTYNPSKTTDIAEIYWQVQLGISEYNSTRDILNLDGTIHLASHVKYARYWAREEIGRHKSRPTAKQTKKTADREYETMQRNIGQYLDTKSLGTLVESILNNWKARGWTQEYSDRLRRSFDQFDPHEAIRKRTILELKDGTLEKIIKRKSLTKSQAYLFYGLMNVICQNLVDIGKVRIKGVSGWRPNRLQISEQTKGTDLSFLTNEEFLRMFEVLQKIPFDWRAKRCIEFSFYSRAPMSRVMRGKWSELDNRGWFPYGFDTWRYFPLEEAEINCLRKVRESAQCDNIISDYWFPSLGNTSQHITNITRAWTYVRNKLDWPEADFSRYRKAHLQYIEQEHLARALEGISQSK